MCHLHLAPLNTRHAVIIPTTRCSPTHLWYLLILLALACFFTLNPPGKTCSQADPCASNPCANGGQCSPFESHYICTCTPTFHGQTCKVDVNECNQGPSPCKNGGTCVNDVGSYRCKCPREYTGKHCEVLYRPCSPSPCLNGGTCMQRGNTTYECTCLPGRPNPRKQPSPALQEGWSTETLRKLESKFVKLSLWDTFLRKFLYVQCRMGSQLRYNCC